MKEQGCPYCDSELHRIEDPVGSGAYDWFCGECFRQWSVDLPTLDLTPFFLEAVSKETVSPEELILAADSICLENHWGFSIGRDEDEDIIVAFDKSGDEVFAIHKQLPIAFCFRPFNQREFLSPFVVVQAEQETLVRFDPVQMAGVLPGLQFERNFLCLKSAVWKLL